MCLCFRERKREERLFVCEKERKRSLSLYRIYCVYNMVSITCMQGPGKNKINRSRERERERER